MVLLMTGAGFSSQAPVIDVLQQLGADIASCNRDQGRASGTANITDAVLEALDGSWAGLSGATSRADDQHELAKGELGQRAFALVDGSNERDKLVIPDARNGFLLPFWRAVFDDDVAVVQCVDAPARVGADIVARDLLPARAAYAIWDYQIRTVLEDAHELPQAWLSLPRIGDAASTQALAAVLGVVLGVEARVNEGEAKLGDGLADEPGAVEPGDLPQCVADLWQYIDNNHGTPMDPDRMPRSVIQNDLLETALFAARHTEASSPDLAASGELEKLRFDLGDIKQRLQNEVLSSLGHEAEQQAAEDEIEALKARNHLLETARSIRLARLVGDPLRRVWRRFS